MNSERVNVRGMKLCDGTLQLEVCVALTASPMRLMEVVQLVSARLGRPVNSRTVSVCLTRAIEMGCCVKTEDGYREPFDALSEDWGTVGGTVGGAA